MADRASSRARKLPATNTGTVAEGMPNKHASKPVSASAKEDAAPSPINPTDRASSRARALPGINAGSVANVVPATEPVPTSAKKASAPSSSVPPDPAAASASPTSAKEAAASSSSAPPEPAAASPPPGGEASSSIDPKESVLLKCVQPFHKFDRAHKDFDKAKAEFAGALEPLTKQFPNHRAFVAECKLMVALLNGFALECVNASISEDELKIKTYAELSTEQRAHGRRIAWRFVQQSEAAWVFPTKACEHCSGNVFTKKAGCRCCALAAADVKKEAEVATEEDSNDEPEDKVATEAEIMESALSAQYYEQERGSRYNKDKASWFLGVFDGERIPCFLGEDGMVTPLNTRIASQVDSIPASEADLHNLPPYLVGEGITLGGRMYTITGIESRPEGSRTAASYSLVGRDGKAYYGGGTGECCV